MRHFFNSSVTAEIVKGEPPTLTKLLVLSVKDCIIEGHSTSTACHPMLPSKMQCRCQTTHPPLDLAPKTSLQFLLSRWLFCSSALSSQHKLPKVTINHGQIGSPPIVCNINCLSFPCFHGGGWSSGRRCSLAQEKGWCWPHQHTSVGCSPQRDKFGSEVEVARDMCKNWFCHYVCMI